MSRSGYCEDVDDLGRLNLWRGTVERAIAGKRGQAFLRALAKALDDMPEKKLIAGELITERGECCTIGALCKAKAIDVFNVDETDPDEVGRLVGIAPAMAAEIEYMNDEYYARETPEERWKRMRAWVSQQLKFPKDTAPERNDGVAEGAGKLKGMG